ncbi:T9SS type A sorting domain-containing protein [Flavobacteriaceae bacterium XHP0103]|uniref:T9SS type A sorting domain-containing protein n=1 Tax=Marixanthotalea marina TaxID=2844359 RepID=UPI002989C86F|nr:M64 family metallopeptidase [Marixanthotalea marina]MBU3821209.1 T9SS type A sorting domain-containing protein [Marixanthotalea marina]
MKHVLLIVLFFSLHAVTAQVFNVEAIKISGDDDKRINLVILSEGYQSGELTQFITDATNFTNTMFGQSPFSQYANYFNVYAIKIPSNESGADHPGTATNVTEPYNNLPTKYVDTYFNATYDSFGTHWLLYYEIDGNSANNTHAKISTVLANNFPMYDQAMILVNSTEYGGSGGDFPMAYTGFWGARVVMHELGHSLFDLKDEYYPGDLLAAEAINMTQETDPNLVRWKNWLGTNNVGIYQYTCDTGNCADWYKPHQNCIMESIDKPFCPVCKEGIIEKIHSLVSPIDAYSPISNSVSNPSFPIDFSLDLIKPNPNTLESTWNLNTVEIATNTDAVSILETDLNAGMNTLTVAVTDATTLLRVDNHETFHVYTVTWSIDNSALGVKDITREENKFNISIYPNPTNNIITFKAENSLDTDLKVDLISIEGKKVKTVTLSNYETQNIDISHLSEGIYIAKFYANNVFIVSKKIIKN